MQVDLLSQIKALKVDKLKDYIKQRGLKLPTKANKDNLIELLYASYLPNFKKDIPPQPALTYVPAVMGDPSTWQSMLEIHGWTVFTIPNFDSLKYITAIQTWLSTFCNMRLDQSESWGRNNGPYNLHGIIKSYIGHTPWLWEIREKCIPIFSQLYGTNNLLCSFDGINISTPKKENKNWLHVDTMRNDMINRCYQSVVNLLPNGPNNGGLCLVSGSHIKLQQYYDNNPGAGLSWVSVILLIQCL